MFLSGCKTAESCRSPASDSTPQLPTASNREKTSEDCLQVNQICRWKGVTHGYRLWLAVLDHIYKFQIEGQTIESQ